MRNFLGKNLSFAIIYFGVLLVLIGGLVSLLFGEEGFIEIKEGQAVSGYWVEDDLFRPVDFSLSLVDFSVEFYPEKHKGMRFVKSYKSLVTIKSGDSVLKEGTIEVNKPLNFREFNFYQYGYDEDRPYETILQVVKDPGMPCAYIGYLILLIGMIFSFKRIFLAYKWKPVL
ncbi:MAG: cytochrome c biogenesis protein ResB [Omnitrophica bacterium]|nr:cytochrome c biogenesis protein ResB [Candidatus Omnitrophota bacterium]